ncbi:MAG: hypothetical protein D3909_03780 [Candidatus Electrothrix sp. ATG1]|nr:hypothetical protein [Candidatus Electrothrix sp. ATG1]MCI5207518.1 hypothetical protein [Candidatus Electrothrix sp. ATG2]
MVVKKDRLNRKKEQELINTFEKFFIVTLGALSLLFLLVTCWFLLTGDDVILLHQSYFSPRVLFLFFSAQFFLWGMRAEQGSNAAMEHMTWSF